MLVAGVIVKSFAASAAEHPDTTPKARLFQRSRFGGRP